MRTRNFFTAQGFILGHKCNFGVSLTYWMKLVAHDINNYQ